MLNRRSFRLLTIAGGLALGVSAWAGGPAPTSFSRDYVPRLDGPPASAASTDGRLWSVWSYRASGEFDIAVAARDASGAWGSTSFLGRRDGIDQVDPSVALDGAGNVYVAFATRSPQRIWTAVLPAGGSAWSIPTLVSPEEGALPAMRIVLDRVVIAYRTARTLRIVDLPVYVSPNSPDGIQDGPEPTGPLGDTEIPIGGSGTPPPPPPPPPGDSNQSSSS
jgi:hypothetical protein